MKALLVMVSLALTVPVQAKPAALIEALNAWDMPRAAQIAKRLTTAGAQDQKALAVLGRWHLMEGRYKAAVETLSAAQALGEDPQVAHYLGLAENTWKETRDYRSYKTKNGHFQVLYPPGPDEIMLPYVDDVLEAAYERLTQIFGHRPPTPIRVEIYPRVDVLGAVSPLTVQEIKTSGTIALCKYNRLMIVSPRDLVYGYGWADTLAHEFIHLIISQKSGNRVPIWLHEGLARYFQERWRSEDRPRLQRSSEHLMAEALRDKSLISFEAMSPSMAKLPSQEATALAFAEVFSAIEFMVSRAGEDVARDIPALMKSGLSDREATARASSIPWNRFEGQWKEFLKSRDYRLQKSGFRQRMLFRGEHTASEELAQVKAQEARQFTWLGDQLRLKGRMRAASKEYGKASKISKRASPIIQAKLGYALIALGRLADAISEMKKVAATYPGYVLLQLYLGRAYWLEQDAAQARVHLEKGLYHNPFDRDLHGLLAQVYEALDLPDLASREKKAHARLQTP